MDTTDKKKEEQRQKATQICQELTQSEMTLFESFVNVAFVLFVNRYPVRGTATKEDATVSKEETAWKSR